MWAPEKSSGVVQTGCDKRQLGQSKKLSQPGHRHGCSLHTLRELASPWRPAAGMDAVHMLVTRTGVTAVARRRHGCSSHARNGTGVTAVARSPEWTQSPKDGVAYTNMFFQSPKIFFDKKISFTIIVCCAWRVAL